MARTKLSSETDADRSGYDMAAIYNKPAADTSGERTFS
jgi:hypothetical protein